MNWFLIAVGAPFLWAIVNHTDKYLLSRFFKNNRGVGALIVFSGLFALVILPFIYLFSPSVLEVTFIDTFILMGSGFMSGVAVLLYLHALEVDEASIVVPFFQLQPIMGYILGYLFFKEILSGSQIIGSLIVIIGAVLLSINLNESLYFKKKIVVLMLASSFCFTFYNVLFKFATIRDSFWISSFWEYLGLSTFGLCLFCFVPLYRKDFILLLKDSSAPIISINIMSELLTTAGNMLTTFAMLLAPVALVLLVSSLQPLFVLLIGITITIIFPKISKEDISSKSLIQKTLAIALFSLGAYFLNV